MKPLLQFLALIALLPVIVVAGMVAGLLLAMGGWLALLLSLWAL